MCGRYVLSTPADVVADFFGLEEALETAPRYNIAPTQEAPIVRAARRGGGRRATLARWGLIPWWWRQAAPGGRLINARAETAAEKPAFRDSFRRRRCIVPADGFYEWRKRNGAKQPFLLRHGGGFPIGFAGLWDRWRPPGGPPVESFTILTTGSNSLLRPIHDRMPVILDPGDFGDWLEPETPARRLGELLRPYPAERMEAVAVSTWVNSPANDSPRCIEEIPAP